MLAHILRRLRFLAWHAQGLALRGNRFYCSVCERRARAFLPVAGVCSIRGQLVDHATPNAICPFCRSGIRQRLIADYIRARTDLLDGERSILHIAPERGISRMLAGAGNYTAMDLNSERFPGAVRGDVTQLPADARYDAVVCSHVLEHIPDDRAAIQSIHGALRPGGVALIAVPTYGDVTFERAGLTAHQRAKEYGCPDHYRLNGRDFANKLAEARFSVEIVELTDPPAWTPHVESDRLLFVARKH